ncbi:PulJ/GspJ family protein [Acinetobacter guerrae]|uniref:PulJ/GspJ family protein n=1 Tax=Acinetobacter guerrae TaxID=1843371 RepID=UPI00125EBD36|nr:prepilin-type N-terminal cleavage/methylation domain-containing protein [Acinetobacter guerrae]
MKISYLTRKHQHGVGLTEALVAVALSSIVILGSAFSMGKMLTSQEQMNLQYIVKNELLFLLQNASVQQKEQWCNKEVIPSITLPKEQNPTEIQVTCETIDITINQTSNSSNNKTITEIQPIKFEITSPLLGGQLTVGESLK